MRKWRRMAAVLGVASVWFVGCVGVGVDTYDAFRGAVEAQASCEQLIDIRKNFNGTSKDKTRIDRDLREIGCRTKDSERADI